MDGKFEGIWFTDSDVYKVLQAAAYELGFKRDPELDKLTDDVVIKIAVAQQPDGYLFCFYQNRLATSGDYRRQAWYGCACCPSNVVRIYPQLGQFLYASDDQSVYLNLYAEGKAKLNVGGAHRDGPTRERSPPGWRTHRVGPGKNGSRQFLRRQPIRRP